MRAPRHRFRPDFGFRPGLDLLIPRIAPSDIGQMLITDPNPVPDGTPPAGDPDDTCPTAIPPANVNTYPNGYVPPASTTTTCTPISPTTIAVIC